MNLLFDILFGKQPPARVREGWDDLHDEGGVMGTLYIGKQGSGKSSSLARSLVEYKLRHPNEAAFLLDWSGDDTDKTLGIISQLPKDTQESLLAKTVYDELANPEMVIPMPEFSLDYGGTMEEQVQRVTENLTILNHELVTNNPTLGGLTIKHLAPMFFRLLTEIKNEHGECWQITETKRLVMDMGLLRMASAKYGDMVPEAKWHLDRFRSLEEKDRTLQSNAILSTLTVVEPREIKASMGYFKPGWTPKEAIEKGLLVIINGARMVNYRMSMAYVFMQRFSLILQEIRRRVPSSPNNLPVTLVLVELKELEKIPGFADIVAELSPVYRSRGLRLCLVVQALNQLSDELRKQIWSLGNIVCFALQDKLDAEAMSYQLFKYDPQSVKQAARTLTQNNITEPEPGQDRIRGDWIQQLKFRECLIRRYVSERVLEPDVIHVSQTRPYPTHPALKPVWDIKEKLLKERAVSVRESLEIINQRKIDPPQRGQPSV